MALEKQVEAPNNTSASATDADVASKGRKSSAVEGYTAQELMLRPASSGGYADQIAALSPTLQQKVSSAPPAQAAALDQVEPEQAREMDDDDVSQALTPAPGQSNRPGNAADAKGAAATPAPAQNVEMKGGASVATQTSKGKGAYAAYAPGVDARATELNVAELDGMPDNVIGAYQRRRVRHALGQMSSADYGTFKGHHAGAASAAERAFLFKALAAGRSIADITWFAGQIAGKDQNWLVDNATLGDPRAQGTGVRQQWSHSCGPSTTLVLQGNYDPVFALRLRQGNDDINRDDQGTSNADLGTREEGMLEGAGGNAVRTNQTGGTGMWATGEMNSRSGSTGLEFENVKDPTPAEALKVLDDRVPAGMQVPTVIGYSPGSYQHYVLCMHRRSQAGTKEYQFHNTGDGTTSWQTETQISGRTMTLGGGNRITALEVPRAA